MDGWWGVSYAVLWLLVIALAVVVVALARQIGTLHLRLGPRGALEMDDEGPALGDAPDSFEVVTIDGKQVTVGGPGEAQLLMFVSPGCMVCEQVLPSINVVARSGSMTPYVLTDVDDFETNKAFAPKRLPAAVASAAEVARSYGVPGTPYIVVLDQSGIVRAKGTVNNLEQMEGLVDTAQRRLSVGAQNHSDGS
jgi:methylamine dehydrogenase accessory protein MauD